MPARLFVDRLQPRRLRTFLVLFALALALPLLALAVFSLNRMASLEQAEIERRVLQIAEDLADDLDRELDRATVTLDTLATAGSLARNDFAAFHEQGTRALRRDKAGILLVDRSYQQLLNTRVPFGTPLPLTADTSTAQKVFDTKQRQFSELIVGFVSRQWLVNVEVPVLQGDTVRYVLIMALDAARFENILQGQKLEPHWITGVTDNNGIILARSERHADFVGKPLPKDLLEQSRQAKGVFRTTSVAGDQILRATVRSKVTGWLISATVPVSYLEAPRRRGELFATAMVGTALALGAVLAYVFGGFMARPLGAAASSAEAIGLGEQVKPLRSPLAEANTITSALSAASSELRSRQERADFLMRELAHRSKNQLAVVKGMALQTARQSGTVDQFVQQFGQRIQGLAESQDLMVRQNWQGAWLRDLVLAHLELFGAGSRADLQGPELFLNANAVQNVGFALHELATNASKHGALSTPLGRVSVSWLVSTDNRLQIEWLERHGPVARPPDRQGFGYLVLTELVAQALQGTAKLDFRSDGVMWRLDIPAASALNSDNPDRSPP